jgi:negative regulator of sigma E activity
MAEANGEGKSNGNGLNALNGWRAQIGQLGAVGVVCAAFWMLLQHSINQAGEERKLFRDSISQVTEAVRKSGEEQAKATRELADQVQALSRRSKP